MFSLSVPGRSERAVLAELYLPFVYFLLFHPDKGKHVSPLIMHFFFLKSRLGPGDEARRGEVESAAKLMVAAIDQRNK